MQLTIEYTAQLRRAAGTAAELVAVEPDCTLPKLVHCLAARHGDELRRLLLDANGRLQRSILVFLGDEQVSPDTASPLKDGQTVTFAAPISGG